MLGITQGLPANRKFIFSCSGGVDSIAMLHYLCSGNRYPAAVIFIHHGTESSRKAHDELHDNLNTAGYRAFVNVYHIEPYNRVKHGASPENYWRKERLQVYKKDKNFRNLPIVLCHHLDDCVEQFIMSTLIRPKEYKLIPFNGPHNIIRPFRTFKKSKIIDYAKKRNLSWTEDITNTDTTFTRNAVRHLIIPEVVRLNPGIYKQVREMVVQEIVDFKKTMINSTLEL